MIKLPLPASPNTRSTLPAMPRAGGGGAHAHSTTWLVCRLPLSKLFWNLITHTNKRNSSYLHCEKCYESKLNWTVSRHEALCSTYVWIFILSIQVFWVGHNWDLEDYKLIKPQTFYGELFLIILFLDIQNTFLDFFFGPHNLYGD